LSGEDTGYLYESGSIEHWRPSRINFSNHLWDDLRVSNEYRWGEGYIEQFLADLLVARTAPAISDEDFSNILADLEIMLN